MQAQQAGLEVSTYTTNEIGKIKQLRAWGIDSIITDFPVRYLHLQRQATLPAPHAAPVVGTLPVATAALP